MKISSDQSLRSLFMEPWHRHTSDIAQFNIYDMLGFSKYINLAIIMGVIPYLSTFDF